jgi:hypothetical protein
MQYVNEEIASRKHSGSHGTRTFQNYQLFLCFSSLVLHTPENKGAVSLDGRSLFPGWFEKSVYTEEIIVCRTSKSPHRFTRVIHQPNSAAFELHSSPPLLYVFSCKKCELLNLVLTVAQFRASCKSHFLICKLGMYHHTNTDAAGEMR